MSSVIHAPNATESLDFLKKQRPQGPWCLTAIDPEKKQGTITATFYPGDEDKLIAFVVKHNRTLNLHFHINPVVRALDKKASKADIGPVPNLHADLDPSDPHGCTTPEEFAAHYERERERLTLRMVSEDDGGKPSKVVPLPTFLIFSGNGVQAIWQLNAPIADHAEAEAYNLGVTKSYGGDSCHNVDRLLRLPGTINWPDAKKRAKGRVPTMATVVWHDPSRVYSLDQFKKAAPQAPTDKLQLAPMPSTPPPSTPLPPWIREHAELSAPTCAIQGATVLDLFSIGLTEQDYVSHLITSPTAANDHYAGDRSNLVFAVVGELHRKGASDEQIVGIITDRGWSCSEHVREQLGKGRRDYAVRQLERLKEKQPTPTNDNTEAPPPLVVEPLMPVPHDLPARPWLIPGWLLDKAWTLLVGRPGSGKSLLELHIAVIVALGRALLGLQPKQARKVLMINCEDNREELQLRLWGIFQEHGISNDDPLLTANLQTVHVSDLHLVAMRENEKGNLVVKETERYYELVKLIKEGNFGLVVLDPLASLHDGLDENNNPHMNKLATALKMLATLGNCPVLTIHHTRKGATASGQEQDAFRGASALVGACRIGKLLEGMTEEQHGGCKPKDRFHYVQITDAKQNYAQRAGGVWLELCQHVHPNGDAVAALSGPVIFDTVKNGLTFETWVHREAFLEMVKKGVPLTGETWTRATTGKGDRRLEKQVSLEFQLELESARAMIKQAETAGHLMAVDEPGKDRKPVKVWRWQDPAEIPF